MHDILSRLRSQAPPLSRNRNFEVFEDPAARRALRIHLRLHKLEQNLIDYAQNDSVKIELKRAPAPQEAFCVLQIEHPGLKLKRRIFLSPEEVALLRQRAEVEKILSKGQGA